MINTSTVEILSQLDAILYWESTGTLGTIVVNEPSELAVNAILTTSSFVLKYKIKEGNLPPGLTVNIDGSISGNVPTDPLVETTSTTYDFKLAVVDSVGYEFMDGDFSITVNQTTSTAYTSAFFRPYLTHKKRREYEDLINDKTVFPLNLIYRPLDKNFGVQKNLKMVLHYGIPQLNFNEYRAIIDKNFSRKKLLLGELKIANSKNKTHELIYVNIIDKLINNNEESLPNEFLFNNTTYYPNSINNMRYRIDSNTDTTDKFNPNYTFNYTLELEKNINYFRFIPICCVKNNTGNIILRKIKEKNFKFNTFDFDVDRLIIENSLDFNNNKYLLFK